MKITFIQAGIYDVNHNGVEYGVQKSAHKNSWSVFDSTGKNIAGRTTKRACLEFIVENNMTPDVPAINDDVPAITVDIPAGVTYVQQAGRAHRIIAPEAKQPYSATPKAQQHNDDKRRAARKKRKARKARRS